MTVTVTVTEGEPAGTAIALTADGSTAVVHPDLGGRLGHLDLGDGALLRGPSPGLRWDSWGCYPLAPWSNRVPGGHLRFGTIDAHLPINHSDGSALHGLVAARSWDIVDQTERAARLRIEVRESPYDIRCELGYDLTPGTLSLALAVTNTGRAPIPAGIGIHPWFHAGPVRVPADRVWPGEPLPTGSPIPVHGDHDLRAAHRPVPMDACFTDLTEWTADAPGVRLRWSGPVTHVVVFSGEPGWVCVEPVTMANDGIALAERGVGGHGVKVLQPGASLEVSYRFERLASG